MEQNRARIQAHGLGLAAISYDSKEILKAFAERERIGYPLLSDTDSKVIRSFGILNETVDKSTPFFGIPHPGTYVLDKRGVVIAKYFEDDFRVRDTAASILLRQFGLISARHEPVRGKHLQLSLSAGDVPVRPGHRVTLALDVQLPSRMHVYAPGVQGYIPIAVTLNESKGFRAEPVRFPTSKTKHLKAIRETVPVFEGRFRLMETVTLAAAQDIEPLLDANRDFTIEGQLRYQACNDRECFVPETVPLKWQVRVLPFDRTRVPEALRRKQ